MVSSQVLVTDLIDAVNSEGKLIKYIEEESVPEDEQETQSTKELKIKVYSPSGEEKIIILKYNE